MPAIAFDRFYRYADLTAILQAFATEHPDLVMIRRDPVETGGSYYRILREGTMQGWDGFMLRVKKNKQRLDLNRNFPANWCQEFEQLGAGHWRVRLVVQNTGWLPSYVSKRALERKVVRGVSAEIALPAGAELVHGKRRLDLGQLEGKWSKHTGVSFWPDHNVTDDRAKIEWVVRGTKGDRIDLLARHERAGTVRATVALG